MLVTEIYKVINDLGPEIIKDIFRFVEQPYNMRNYSTLQRRRNCTVYFRTWNMSFLASKMWEKFPCVIKTAKSLDICKEKVKLWTTNKCPCRLCKRYNVSLV